jgi:lycopene cyclase domain-containing protein
MPEKYTYLIVDLCCIIFPFIFSFHSKLLFYKQWRFFLIPCAITTVLFLVWDVIFTYLGIWGFDKRYLIGFFILNLPIEEVLFFICIPFACVFSYYCFNLYIHCIRFHNQVRIFYFFLSVVLLVVALLHLTQLYTSITFILLAVLLLYLVVKNEAFLPSFFICFLFILFPFLLSNGVLTGSYFDRIIVHYNDKYNLGIRVLTIPVEDVFYGMLLLLLNVYGFEKMKKKS